MDNTVYESKYTTIQITKRMNEHIKSFCKKNGLVSATITEKLWSDYISASLSVNSPV